MSISESQAKPEPVSDEAPSMWYPARISSLLMVGGPVVAAAAVAGVLVLAALTSWWLLFALFALPPLMMIVCAPLMTATMRNWREGNFWGAPWCGPGLRSDLGRGTQSD